MHWRAHRRDVMNRNIHCVGHGPTFVSTIHFDCWTRKNILVLSIHIAATATNDINLAICIVPSRAYILKPSICIAGWLRKILNEKYRITYCIVQSVKICKVVRWRYFRIFISTKCTRLKCVAHFFLFFIVDDHDKVFRSACFFPCLLPHLIGGTYIQ